jgi:hypothetical protein
MDGHNYAVCGPNGSGKSGVVDAIEFCITGDVTRLSGPGTSGISVKDHAPHVDHHDHPENAKVKITAIIPSLGKTVSLQRSVKNPRKLAVSPRDPDIKAVIDELQYHPEFALSRREIVKYILTPPGKRSDDVQTLLKLDSVEDTRKAFTSLRNRQKTEADAKQRVQRTAETDLCRMLQIDTFDSNVLLKQINDKRTILGLNPVKQLLPDISTKDETPNVDSASSKTAIHKSTALADLASLQTSLEAAEPDDLTTEHQSANSKLKQLAGDRNALDLLRKVAFIKIGIGFIHRNACPLCDMEWEADTLHEYLKKKLLAAEAAEKLLSDLHAGLNIILQHLSERAALVKRAIEHGNNLTPPQPLVALAEYNKRIKDINKALTEFIGNPELIDAALQATSKSWWGVTPAAHASIVACLKAIARLPDAPMEGEAREYLIVAQERYGRFTVAAIDATLQVSRLTVSNKVLEHYNASCTSVLEKIYDDVSETFSGYYRAINSDDEENFIGALKVSPPNLDLAVDFYERGLFPPNAYHSEGHQDSMGLCLYLALMKHTLQDRFTFSVLDDVLMSVDSGHRREVCRLLKSEFPKTQFILTTHDRVWLQYMKTENLISRSRFLGGWSIDAGPRVWDDQDVWEEIRQELARNDVPKAAALLRRFLEYTAVLLADNLRARVQFRSDGNYELGDLMVPVLTTWRNLIGDGVDAAEHWNNSNDKKKLEVLRAEVKKLVGKSQVENWAINPAVHFNEWMNLGGQEFTGVVGAFKSLLEKLRCENPQCGVYHYVMGPKTRLEALRCDCGATNINLKIGK